MNINRFNPTADVSPYLSVYGSQTLQPWRYQFGVMTNYARDPAEVGALGARRVGIVDHLIMTDVSGAFGVTDWFQLALDVPVAVYVDEFDLIGNEMKVVRMSDVRFEPKFRLVDIDRHSIGLSVLPTLIIPTGSGDDRVGNNSWAGGGKIILDAAIGERVQIATNFGYVARKSVTVVNVLEDHRFTYGAGLSIKAADWMDMMGEVSGSTNVSNFFKEKAESPLEADGGLRFSLPQPEGFAITVGGGVGFGFGYGTPTYRALLGVSYPNPKHVYLPVAPPPPVEEAFAKVEKKKIVITKKVHFEFDRSGIRPVSYPILDAVVDILKENADILKVRIEGYCDSKGTDKYNLKLSQRRVQTVKVYLTSHGIEASRLTAVGYGESQPIADNTTPEGRARNRRVVFTILDQEGPETSKASE